MSKIRKVAINSYGHYGISYSELNRLAKQFDYLTDDELKKEFDSIESMLCRYDAESVALYRIAMTLYNVVCERHNNAHKIL